MKLPALIMVGLVLAPASAAAQASTWGNGFGFQWQIGYKSVGGGYGDLLTDGIDADINIFYNHNKLRIGGGGNFVSLNVVEPLQDESVSSVELHAFLGYHFLRGNFQPYVQGRFNFVRMRPEGHDFDFDPEAPPEDPEEGENLADRRAGFGGGLVAGFEYRLSRKIGLEANASIDAFATEEVDLAEIEEPSLQGTFTDGNRWGFRVGINWYP